MHRTAGTNDVADRESENHIPAAVKNSEVAARAELARADTVDRNNPKLKLAREILEKFLGGTRGPAAVEMIMNHVDKDGSGEISVREFKSFLKGQDVGNFATRGIMASQAVDYMSGGGESLTRDDISKFIDIVGLGTASG